MFESGDLDLITTQKLIETIMGRADHGIISLLIVTKDNHDGTGDNRAEHVWKGCSLTCAGLAAEIQNRILHDRVGKPEDEE